MKRRTLELDAAAERALNEITSQTGEPETTAIGASIRLRANLRYAVARGGQVVLELPDGSAFRLEVDKVVTR